MPEHTNVKTCKEQASAPCTGSEDYLRARSKAVNICNHNKRRMEDKAETILKYCVECVHYETWWDYYSRTGEDEQFEGICHLHDRAVSDTDTCDDHTFNAELSDQS